MLWSANPLNTLKIAWNASDEQGVSYFDALRKSGKRIICIDPMRSETLDFFGHVGAHMRRDPLGAVAEEIQRFRTHRIDTDDALAAFAQRIKVGNALLVGRIPGKCWSMRR